MPREKSIQKALQDKAKQIADATELLIAKTRDWQVIKQFINNRISKMDLTPGQLDKYERYQYIYNQLASGKYTEQQVISQLTNKDFFGVSLTQAYEDISNTREIFSTTLHINKRFELKMELESARKMKIAATEVGNFTAAFRFQKNILYILAQIEETDSAPGELFEGHEIEAVFDPSLLGAPKIKQQDLKDLLSAINSKHNKKIDLSFIQDIEYEDA